MYYLFIYLFAKYNASVIDLKYWFTKKEKKEKKKKRKIKYYSIG